MKVTGNVAFQHTCSGLAPFGQTTTGPCFACQVDIGPVPVISVPADPLMEEHNAVSLIVGIEPGTDEGSVSAIVVSREFMEAVREVVEARHPFTVGLCIASGEELKRLFAALDRLAAICGELEK